MASTIVPGSVLPDADVARGGAEPAGATDRRAVVRWGVASYLAVVAVMAAATLWWLGGSWAYVLDDAAIHLSMADRLAHDGTWGVTAGNFESASSAPLWTVLLAAGVAVAGGAAHALPLVLNLVAGVAVIWLLAGEQSALRPARSRPLDAAVTVLLVTVVLFLPGLALVGMEHTLHVALVLAAVAGVDRWVGGRPGPRPWQVYGLVALATLARFESAFVAAGLAVALIATGGRAHRRRAAGVAAASGLTIAAFAAVNRALGGDWLPNSVLAKGQGPGQAQQDGVGPVDIVGRLTQDPVLAALVALAVVYLLVRGRRGRAATPATVLVVAAALHVALADVGWYERYQSYLVAVGVLALLAMLTEVPAALRSRVLVAVCVLAAVFGTAKVNLTVKAPLASDDMYRQQYHAGRFLASYYDGRPVATDQLGYISWYHDGPLTDFAGLGDRAVLDLRRGDHERPELWGELARERGFPVAVLYDISTGFDMPDGWILAGKWVLDGEPTTGVSETLQFWATSHTELEALQDHLADFEDDLPARVELVLNENAPLQAMALAAAEDEAGSPGGDGG